MLIAQRLAKPQRLATRPGLFAIDIVQFQIHIVELLSPIEANMQRHVVLGVGEFNSGVGRDFSFLVQLDERLVEGAHLVLAALFDRVAHL